MWCHVFFLPTVHVAYLCQINTTCLSYYNSKPFFNIPICRRGFSNIIYRSVEVFVYRMYWPIKKIIIVVFCSWSARVPLFPGAQKQGSWRPLQVKRASTIRIYRHCDVVCWILGVHSLYQVFVFTYYSKFQQGIFFKYRVPRLNSCGIIIILLLNGSAGPVFRRQLCFFIIIVINTHYSPPRYCNTDFGVQGICHARAHRLLVRIKGYEVNRVFLVPLYL